MDTPPDRGEEGRQGIGWIVRSLLAAGKYCESVPFAAGVKRTRYCNYGFGASDSTLTAKDYLFTDPIATFFSPRRRRRASRPPRGRVSGACRVSVAVMAPALPAAASVSGRAALLAAGTAIGRLGYGLDRRTASLRRVAAFLTGGAAIDVRCRLGDAQAARLRRVAAGRLGGAATPRRAGQRAAPGGAAAEDAQKQGQGASSFKDMVDLRIITWSEDEVSHTNDRGIGGRLIPAIDKGAFRAD
jgi:hypothetical protein